MNRQLLTIAPIRTRYVNTLEGHIYVMPDPYDNYFSYLQIFDADDTPLITPTINLSSLGHNPLDRYSAFIQTWGPNDGILQPLLDARVISAPIRTIDLDAYQAYECAILHP